ncbi:hypothetical protein [Chryseobacterium arthrosphaerae]|uniref:Uncharacterized protein n=1 Tax=Chryseobacterium arthrosphaerae TaxID=651561 RepID=A0A1B8ZSI3_9FLAO|nr:hypothetical protein [Chryseobacterium arthrosphaerae]OCA74533.1 hypothetical protein BBI00_09405 [Chryseobacterium arthrosphaerae]
MNKAYINNNEINMKRINYSQIDFGKLDTNVDYNEYRILISLNDFINKIKPKYDSFLEEYIEDDKIDNDFTPMYDGAENYPDFNMFMNLKSDQKIQIINGYFIFIILGEFIDDYSVNNKEIYLLKNLEKIIINSEHIIFEGKSTYLVQ